MVDGTMDSSSFRGTFKIDGYSADGQILLKRVANLRAATIRSVFSRQLLKSHARFREGVEIGGYCEGCRPKTPTAGTSS